MEPGIRADVVGLALLAVVGLAVAAWRYDRWISQLEEQGQQRGYVSLLVAAGCAGVLGAALVVVWPLGPDARLGVVVTAGLFAPAGLPMVLGSIRRHVDARQADERRMTAEARDALQGPR